MWAEKRRKDGREEERWNQSLSFFPNLFSASGSGPLSCHVLSSFLSC